MFVIIDSEQYCITFFTNECKWPSENIKVLLSCVILQLVTIDQSLAYGVVSQQFYLTSFRYIQVGNAVAVPVSRALGYALGLTMQGSTTNEPLFTLPRGFPNILDQVAPVSSEDV